MTASQKVVVASLIGLALGATALAETEARVTELAGFVGDEQGQPLVGAIVSLFGHNLVLGARTAVTDEDGRFSLGGIPPGLYRLRAYLQGFFPSPFTKVVVEEGMEEVGSILMSLSSTQDEPTVHVEANEERTLAELKWILQHADRNILREEDRWVPVATLESRVDTYEPAFSFSGELGVRAADFEQGLSEFPGAGAGLDARLAYARLFIPTRGDGHWFVSAQLLESALSSWAGRAEYVTGELSGHRVAGGVSYGNYLYGDVQAFRPPEVGLIKGVSTTGTTEWFGSLYASDTFLLGSTSVSTNLSYQHFDYLDTSGYWSPQIEVTRPVLDDATVLRGKVDYHIQAPGGEDIGLLSQVAYADVYGPAPANRGLRAERTARFELGLERQLSQHTRVAVRLFEEDAEAQLVKTFTESVAGFGGGHFRVSNRGDFQTRGFGVSLFQNLGEVEGTVGYTFGRAQSLSDVPGEDALGFASGEDIHDVTTTLATSIERTRTRLHAAYRVIAHPRLAMLRKGFVPGRELDTRFSVQVYQLLPFVGWNGTRWELMVAVRNLFYEDLENSSLLDEFAVVDAPRRVLGGVTVRF
ncbi:MAG TPA: carboxypeptidase regulatory-like domain-containing protein [Vicinamibacteria bacterium]|nr:carboxypeptidase regulatory-like domain-containing protein [Vicinamibacteria bacterium]